MSDEQREERLAQLSSEIEQLIERVASDVRQQRAVHEPEQSGFVLYLLRESDLSPINSRDLREIGIRADDIENTDGFSALSKHCDELKLQARIEDIVRSGYNNSAPCLGIVVDGWQ